MDFETQNSDLKSTEDIVPAESNGSIAHDDGYDLNTNGNGCSEPYIDPKKVKEGAEELNCNDHENVELCPGYGSLRWNRSTSGEYVDAVTAVSLSNSGGKGAENDLDVADSCVSPPMMKGKGLRKWRRIRREFITEGTLNKDSAKMLKRGSEDLVNPEVGLAETKQKSNGSESSVNEILHNVLNTDAFPIGGGGSTFSAGTGSDEDRDSKSSTAGSVPKSRNDIPRPSGYSRNKHDTKHASEHLGNAPQPLQHGLGNADASKKSRGDAFNLDKENSVSSPESDSGSYSYGFMHCPSTGINNGQSDRGAYDGEHGDDGPVGEQQPVVEELPTGPSISAADEEIPKGDAAFSWKFIGRDKNHQISGNWDPLVDCLQMLQSTQEALEQELQKFGKLGKDLRPFDDDSIRTSGVGAEFCAASSSACPKNEVQKFDELGKDLRPFDDDSIRTSAVGPEFCAASFSACPKKEIHKFGEQGKDLRPYDDDSVRTSGVGPEFCAASYSACPTPEEFGTDIPDFLISLTKNIEIFEKQIEETRGMLREKETTIAELQATVNNLKSSNEALQRNVDVQQKNYKEIEADVETLCKQKVEAEILYLAIADTSIVAENQMKLLLAEQKSLVSSQAQELRKVANLESKAAKLEDKARRGIRGLTSGKGEARTMQKRIAKFTFCFFIQLILFFCVFEFFVSKKFLSKATAVLPT